MRDEPLTVLLIEDNPGDVRILQLNLSEARGTAWRLECADHLSAGLERLAQSGVDVVLLDLSLPDSQGLESFTRLRAHAPAVPIVVLTGLDDETLAVKAVQSGAQDYLVKGQVDGNLLVRSMRYAIERQKAEETLRESEERLRLVARATNEAIWTWEIATGAVSWNETFEKLFGYTAGAIQPTFEWRCERIHPEDRRRVHAGLWAAIVEGEETWTDEYRFLRSQGGYAAVRDHAYVMRDRIGQPVRVVGAMLDVTEHRQLEQQFLQAQKMEAVGRLAGGIAHDFNNMLEVVVGYSHLLLARTDADDPRREILEVIQESAERAAKLTRQLLVFSRKQVLARQVLDLNELVAHMADLLRRMIGEDVQLVTRLGSGPARVKADPGQIEQVLMNLAVNARDAMPRGGRLTIETASVHLDGPLSGRHADAGPGHYVMLTVSDTGCGMDLEIQSHLFEPFFTTKELGKGTGLGLATVYGIIQQSGGQIEVQSAPGQGAMFKIYLPRTDADAPAGRGPEASSESSPASETILVAEDDARVRKLVCGMLEMSGYTVLESRDGEEALKTSEQHGGPIHLLLTDVLMSGTVRGPDLAKHLAVARPEMKVLFMSGHTDPAFVHDDDLRMDAPLLLKPFTPAQLARKLRELLGGSPQGVG